VYSSIGTTVFRGTRNFEPSHGICLFSQNFYIFVEFSTDATNMPYFGRFQAAVNN